MEFNIATSLFTVISGDNASDRSLVLKNEFDKFNDVHQGVVPVYITPVSLLQDRQMSSVPTSSSPILLHEVISHLQQLLSSSDNKTNMETDFGVKALTHFLSMLSSGTIHSSIILFWDLPESFLHPSWQVAVSRLLVMCASSGVRICLSTQSPYMVQAVRFYSQKQNLKVYYILAELDSSGASLVSDVTDDLNRLFYPLAMPLSRIMNIYK